MMWLSKGAALLFVAFVLLLYSQHGASEYTGNIMFDLPEGINVTFLKSAFTWYVRNYAYSEKVRDGNFSFSNFPIIPLYSTASSLLAEKAKLEPHTLVTIGSLTYYGLKLTMSRINTTVPNYFMNYVPVFDFPVTLHAKIIEKVYAHIRKNDLVQTTRTMFVLNSTTVNPQRPWENVEILNAMLKEVSGSLRFMYFHNNSDEIARKIRDTQVNDIVVMVNSFAVRELLIAANQRSLLTWRYRWIIYLSTTSDLDIESIGFNSNSENITVIQFADVDQNSTFTLKNSLACVSFDALGIVLNLMQKVLSNVNSGLETFAGRTGNFLIDYDKLYADPSTQSCTRENWIMHVFHGLGSRARVVGNITGITGEDNITLNLPEPRLKIITEASVRQELADNPFRITTVIESPFVQFKANASRYPLMKDKLEGFVIDIMRLLMDRLNITYTVELEPSGKYGSLQSNGQWNGMILQVMNGRANMAVAGFSITNERKRVVSFLESYMGFKGAILLKENTEQGVQAMFQFLRPFDIKVWGMLLGSMLAIALVLALLHCISPNKTNYNLYESFFFSLGSVFQGVTTTPPDKPSGRIIVCFWWFFSLIIVITYIANYGAYRTQARIQGVITSLQDLLNQNQYKYGTVKDTAYDTLFKTSTFEYMQKLNKMIRQEFKDGLVDNAEIAIDLVKQGQYAFIWDNTITRYYAYRDCLKSTAEFDQYYYGFIVPKNADYKDLLNKYMLQFKEQGEITYLLRNYPYIDGSKTNASCQYSGFLGIIRKYIPKDLFKYSSSDALTLEQTLGIFIIMISGCIISLILALIECACRLCCQKCMDRKTRMKSGNIKKKGESYA